MYTPSPRPDPTAELPFERLSIEILYVALEKFFRVPMGCHYYEEFIIRKRYKGQIMFEKLTRGEGRWNRDSKAQKNGPIFQPKC